MIQLLTKDNKVLYELPESELFPNYISVLKEAIKLQVDLSELLVDSQIINNIKWKSLKFKNITFLHCSMTDNSFEECGGYITCIDCNLCRLKIKKSELECSKFYHCNLSDSTFRKVTFWHFNFKDCNLDNTIFQDIILQNIWFKNCHLSEAQFVGCKINNFYFENFKTNEWYHNMALIDCHFSTNEYEISEFSNNIDLSELLIWNINYGGLFSENRKFIEIKGDYTSAIIACYSKIIWWKALCEDNSTLPFRHPFDDFINEAKNNFPSIRFDEMYDCEIKEELLAICEYIKYWMRDQ